jgi:beta-xylosidase
MPIVPQSARSARPAPFEVLRALAIACLTVAALAACQTTAMQTSKLPPVWQPDLGNGSYKNPVLNADYSDPDVIRVGNDYYLTSSSFSDIPGLPILHSKDLVNWTIIGHVFDHYPLPGFETPQHGDGVWAPALRYHEGLFYVYFGDPDNGIFMATAKNPAGPWSPLHLVKKSKGWIDTCPFWDDDGQAYLVHAYANSRAGVKDMLDICRMAPDGKSLLDEGKLVVDGRNGKFPTVEGPKLYKRNGYYYILAPAGGVTGGYQMAFRSKNIFGPYEAKKVMAQGATPINGPHQGGWVTTQTGQDWFMHFQDRGPYGRVVLLEPMKWVNDWPVIGDDPDGDGTGEPVLTFRKPDVGRAYPPAAPQTSDDFSSPTLGLQWQWPANPQPAFYSLTARPGWLRLNAQPLPAGGKNLWDAPNLLLQKLPADRFHVATRIDGSGLAIGERAGLVVMGQDYACAAIEHTATGWQLVYTVDHTASTGSA